MSEEDHPDSHREKPEKRRRRRRRRSHSNHSLEGSTGGYRKPASPRLRRWMLTMIVINTLLGIVIPWLYLFYLRHF
jgi:hypothetical protein